MEKLKVISGIKELIQKYKYILLVVTAGILLMVMPGINKSPKDDSEQIAPVQQEISVETSLCTILSKIHGAGRVEVMLTTEKGAKTLYQTNLDRSDSQTREDTVIISNDQRAQNGLITQVIPPIYQGAIVVCDGADDPSVRFNIVDAVSKATGLGANQISVLKMK